LTVNGMMQIYQSTLARKDGAKVNDVWMANIVAKDNRDDNFIQGFIDELIERDEPIPMPLKKYIAQRNESRVQPAPKPKTPGPKRGNRFHRDGAIVRAISFINREYKFPPYRNREQVTRESACSIVSKALAALGYAMNEAAVEKIWEKSVRERRRARETDGDG
jgi:hypothetical protein